MTEKSQACHCKVTSLSLQSHKPITEKSQACDGKVTSLSLQSHKPITEKSQKGWWNLCREFVWVEALCGTLKEWCSKYVTACGGWLIGWFPPALINQGGSTHFSIAQTCSCVGVDESRGFYIHNYTFVVRYEYMTNCGANMDQRVLLWPDPNSVTTNWSIWAFHLTGNLKAVDLDMYPSSKTREK